MENCYDDNSGEELIDLVDNETSSSLEYPTSDIPLKITLKNMRSQKKLVLISEMERHFGCSFTEKRPFWLRDLNGKQMKFCGFNPDIKVAFLFESLNENVSYREYYTFNSYDKSIEKQRKYKLKLVLCRTCSVFLIYIPCNILIRKIEKFIRKNYYIWKNIYK